MVQNFLILSRNLICIFAQNFDLYIKIGNFITKNCQKEAKSIFWPNFISFCVSAASPHKLIIYKYSNRNKKSDSG